MKKLAILCVTMAIATILLGAADAPPPPPAAPKETPAAKADLKNLQGTWKVVRAENNGMDVMERLGYETFEVEGNNLRVIYKGEERKSSFELDPAHDPKWVNFTTPQGKQIEGIYELKGDTWKTMSSGRGRPATFEDKGAVLFVYERAKKGAATKPAAPK